MTNFVGITIEQHAARARVLCLGASTGAYLYNENTLSTATVLDFLFQLHKHVKSTFIWYAATRDVEILLRELPPSEKDKAFPSAKIDRFKKLLRTQIDVARAILKQTRDAKEIKHTVKKLLHLQRVLHNFEYVFFTGYTIKVLQGKQLTIRKGNKSVTIYDIFSFFKKPLPETAREYLGSCPPALDRTAPETPLPLWDNAETRLRHKQALREYVEVETQTLVQLATRVQACFAKAGIELKRWYGISAAANRCLNAWKANLQFTKQTEENTPRELWRALSSAYYGGRIETLKLGTVANGTVYDINAAYPFAASLLSRASGKWQFSSTYDINSPFAVWYVNYCLPSNHYLGILPHRTSAGATVYRQAGRGWYYAPEVRELARRFPDCVSIQHGYIMPYNRIRFGEQIEELYDYRNTLKKSGRPEEKLFKGLLHAVCGKFSQTIGQPRFYCLSWAGWITSFVRAMLLAACEGQEHSVICFAQDAIHSLAPLKNLRVGDGLGEWKQDSFDRGVYLQSGVYQKDSDKKTRGLEAVDFNNALFNLNRGLNVTAEREYFVGWRMSQSLTELRGEVLRFVRPYGEKVREELARLPGKYLEHVKEIVSLDLFAVSNRSFETRKIDWQREHLDSAMLVYNNGRESRMRKERDNMRRHNLMLDTVTARRY